MVLDVDNETMSKYLYTNFPSFSKDSNINDFFKSQRI
jgi:hypothetical protein